MYETVHHRLTGSLPWVGSDTKTVTGSPMGLPSIPRTCSRREVNRAEQAGLVALAMVGLACSTAQAQWTVTYLHPAGPPGSTAQANSNGQQAGWAYVDGQQHASVWNGTAASWMDLNPVGATQSVAYAASNGQQAGFALVSGFGHASLWSGTPASWVDLQPTGAMQSTAYSASGSEQAGYAQVLTQFGSVRHAGIWNGSAGSWVDLNPANARASEAFATSGASQVGYLTTISPGTNHAALWSGSAASCVDLNPASATTSFAYAVNGAIQGGYAGLLGGARHASLWGGTASTWVDVNPAGSTASEIWGIADGYEVGYATIGGVQHASIWNGTAASWEDLSFALPGWLGPSHARGIWSDGSVLVVVGDGVAPNGGGLQAVMWSRSVPEPGTVSMLLLSGLIASRRSRRRGHEHPNEWRGATSISSSLMAEDCV